MKHLLLTLTFLVSLAQAHAQYGCTDLQATNYNPSALFNDGSCIYPATTLSASQVALLQTPALDENSGLVYSQGVLWTHVDDTYEELYRIDTLTGAISQTVTIPFSNNTDWEDVSLDSDFVYIGDIGNNNGNRTDLRFFRIPRAALDTTPNQVATVDTICFSYSDQTDFTAAYNNTRFDAEAFVVINDTIHLFSKDWVFSRARHYVLPATPGTHIAQLRDSIDANGLITGATLASDGAIALIGYDKVFPAPCFVWLLFDYSGSEVYSGNKRYFSLGSAITYGQTEAITFSEGHKGYLSNERFQQSILNVAPTLRRFDLSPFIVPASTLATENTVMPIAVNPQPATGELHVSFRGPVKGRWRLISLSGLVMAQGEFPEASVSIRCDGIPSSLYVLEVIGSSGQVYRTRVIIG
ncbi:MAG: T9SS C-terminal target domain-containing protein [Bacteroidota bacterium]